MKKWREFLEGGMKKRFLSKKGNHPHRATGPPGHRADGPPGRRKKKNIRNKKKQEAERRKEEAERKNIRQGMASGRRKTEAGRKHTAKSCKAPHRYIYFPLEIISIVRYRPYQI